MDPVLRRKSSGSLLGVMGTNYLGWEEGRSEFVVVAENIFYTWHINNNLLPHVPLYLNLHKAIIFFSCSNVLGHK